VKTLQLRWTDIEIRKHRLTNLGNQGENSFGDEVDGDLSNEDDGADLPPLEVVE